MKALLAVGSTGVALLVVEIALRLVHPGGPFEEALAEMGFEPTWFSDVPYRHAPCPHCDPVRSDQHLVGPDQAPSRADEAIRVVVVGDSMSVGYGLDYDDTWPGLLAHELETVLSPRPVQLFNLATGGYELGEVAASYQRWGRAYQPHLVVHALFVNDFARLKLLAPYGEQNVLVSFLPFQGGVGPAALLPGKVRVALFRHVYLYQWLTPRIHGLLLHGGSEDALLAGHMTDDEAKDLLRTLARDIRGEPAIPFVALLPPSTWTDCVDPGGDESCEDRSETLDRARSILRAEGVPHADFRVQMRSSPELDYTIHDIQPQDMDHYGRSGHAELAEFLAAQLLEQGIVEELGGRNPER